MGSGIIQGKFANPDLSNRNCLFPVAYTFTHLSTQLYQSAALLIRSQWTV